MTENDINNAISLILKDKGLRKKAGLGFRLKYELENQDKRPVHVRKKLELLWQAGLLEIKQIPANGTQ